MKDRKGHKMKLILYKEIHFFLNYKDSLAHKILEMKHEYNFCLEKYVLSNKNHTLFEIYIIFQC